jgi:hypothetical protein
MKKVLLLPKIANDLMQRYFQISLSEIEFIEIVGHTVYQY